MSGLRPKLVLDKDGKVCMQITLNEFTVIEPLPEDMAAMDENRLQQHFNKLVPGMAQELWKLRRQKNRKIRKKAKCVTGSIR